MPQSDSLDIGNSLNELNEDVIKALHILSGFSYSKADSYPKSRIIDSRYSWDAIKPIEEKKDIKGENENNIRSELRPFQSVDVPNDLTVQKVLLEIPDQFLAYAIINKEYTKRRYEIALRLYQFWLAEQSTESDSTYPRELKNFKHLCQAQESEKNLYKVLLETVAKQLEATRIHLFLLKELPNPHLQQEIEAHFTLKQQYSEGQDKRETLEAFYKIIIAANGKASVLKLASAHYHNGRNVYLDDWPLDQEADESKHISMLTAAEEKLNQGSEGPYHFPVFRFLFDEEGLGGKTLEFLREIEQSETALSDANLISILKNIEEAEHFANFLLTKEEGSKSQMMVALVDEFQGQNRVLGVMKIFSCWKEPLFSYKQNEVISMVKEAVGRLALLGAKKEIQIYEKKLLSLYKKDPEVWDKNDINSGIRHLEGFKKCMDRLGNYQSSIDYRFLESELSFRYNCFYNFSLKSISIKNTSFFGETNWEFHDQLNILVGKNGYGKSYLLRLLLAMATQDEQHIKSYLQQKGTSLVPNIELIMEREEKEKKSGISKSSIQVNRDLNTYSYLINSEKKRFPVGYVPILAIPDIRFTKRASFVPGIGMPFDGDLKRIGVKAFLEGGDFQNMVGEFLSELCINFYTLKEMYFKETGKSLASNELFKIEPYAELQTTVRRLTNNKRFRFIDIRKKESESGFEFLIYLDENNPEVPIQQLSQGMISIMAIFGIIYRYLKSLHFNNQNTYTDHVKELKSIKNKKGIVFIDEIDAHLHPMVQLIILGELTQTFGEVQFFVSSHSPLVVVNKASLEEAFIKKLTKTVSGLILEDVEINVEDAYIQVLIDVFELDSSEAGSRNHKAWKKLRDMLIESNHLKDDQ